MKNKISLFWFRRDLRLEDNVGLYHALQSEHPVLPIFIFDTDILDKLESKHDRRVDYIHQALSAINVQLKASNSAMITYHGKPLDIFKTLLEEYDIQSVFCNRDYEPQAIERDANIFYYLQQKNIPFKAYKDQVIFDKKDILKNDETPYVVYTPYARKWREKLTEGDYKTYKPKLNNLMQLEGAETHSLKDIGFEKTDILYSAPKLDAQIIDDYDKHRDYPALQGTTQLGTALRFGTISIRKCVAFALQHNQTWLAELIWREFFMQILYHFPHVVNHSFKPKYEFIEWRNNEVEFQQWCDGKTGYPIVDAGMQELNQTGYMHNRVRMITASFLCKHLLIDWKWGEAYFAAKLDDYELSSNNGNWQWVAGSGCDAAPYFRIFNPTTQTDKFDKNHEYIKNWLPELGTAQYPNPIVDHKFARERVLTVYSKALKDK
ncbi:MAG TPA: deoxyribodipyrimidine photo-lyase [Dysgonamonadaceae bacterium]|nr:deoxyribodipyrimidine photo-lyase [Dysgonamonadaceae bacterium]